MKLIIFEQVSSLTSDFHYCKPGELIMYNEGYQVQAILVCSLHIAYINESKRKSESPITSH